MGLVVSFSLSPASVEESVYRAQGRRRGVVYRGSRHVSLPVCRALLGIELPVRMSRRHSLSLGPAVHSPYVRQQIMTSLIHRWFSLLQCFPGVVFIFKYDREAPVFFDILIGVGPLRL